MVVAKHTSAPWPTRFYVVVTVASIPGRITPALRSSGEVADQRNYSSLDYRVADCESICLVTRPAEILVAAMSRVS